MALQTRPYNFNQVAATQRTRGRYGLGDDSSLMLPPPDVTTSVVPGYVPNAGLVAQNQFETTQAASAAFAQGFSNPIGYITLAVLALYIFTGLGISRK